MLKKHNLVFPVVCDGDIHFVEVDPEDEDDIILLNHSDEDIDVHRTIQDLCPEAVVPACLNLSDRIDSHFDSWDMLSGDGKIFDGIYDSARDYVVLEVLFNKYRGNFIPEYIKWMSLIVCLEDILSKYRDIVEREPTSALKVEHAVDAMRRMIDRGEFRKQPDEIIRTLSEAQWIIKTQDEQYINSIRFHHEISDAIWDKQVNKFVRSAVRRLALSIKNHDSVLNSDDCSVSEMELLHHDTESATYTGDCVNSLHDSYIAIVAFLENRFTRASQGSHRGVFATGARIKAEHVVAETAVKVMDEFCKRHGVAR